MKIFAFVLLMFAAVSGQAQEPAVNRVQTMIKDTKGRLLSNAYCAVFPAYGPPHAFTAMNTGQVMILGPEGSLMRCVKDKETFEVSVPAGEPNYLLMKPLPLQGDCAVYSLLPAGISNVACVADKDCRWTGWGPSGACRQAGKQQE